MRWWPVRIRGADSVPDVPEDPMSGLAEVRIIAAHPDVAQRVAWLLRQNFRCDEPRSYPTGVDGRGTLLHLTVDTGHVPGEPPVESPWLVTSRSQARRAHTDEPPRGSRN
ncbi:hypothetical protein ACFV0T_30865 [Streptomyces sp. NPDC059582]|uniref:hypothetical protein n=1 Tax=Streptomyces sp. NPDC059582 TaxID=3346875 RepID=UPI0036C8F0AF